MKIVVVNKALKMYVLSHSFTEHIYIVYYAKQCSGTHNDGDILREIWYIREECDPIICPCYRSRGDSWCYQLSIGEFKY